MPRYIDAEKICYFWHQKADGGFSEGVTLQSMINEVPTADVEEVKHGYWEQMKAYKSLYVCSRCGDLFPDYKSDYCPSCGAKMDGVTKIDHDSLCETETYIHEKGGAE